MGKTAILSIRIVGDAADAVAAFAEAENRAKGFERGMDKAAAASAVAVGGLVALAAQVSGVASEAEQAAGAVESVFGTSASQVQAYAEGAAQAVGLSTSTYNQLASVFGAQLGNMGVAADQLAGQTDSLITLGADLAATFGGTTADAVGALSSLLRGERDPIERYGVSIKQADVNARMAEMGLSGLTGEAERNAQMQATLALLTEQTAAAQGQFGREASTAAGQQQRMTAEWENAQAALGEALLPVLTEGSKILAEMARWVQENSDAVLVLGGILGGAAAAILAVNAGLKVYKTVQAAATIAQWAFNAAAAANPVVLIVMAIIVAVGLLVAAILWVWNNWDEVCRWMGEAANNVGAAFEAVGQWIGGVVEGIIGWISDLVGWIQDAVRWLTDMLGLTNSAGKTVSGFDRGDGPRGPGVAGASSLTAYSAITYQSAPALTQYGDIAAARSGGDTYITNKVEISGVIDKASAGRELEKVLNDHAARQGRKPAFAGGDTRWR